MKKNKIKMKYSAIARKGRQSGFASVASNQSIRKKAKKKILERKY